MYDCIKKAVLTATILGTTVLTFSSGIDSGPIGPRVLPVYPIIGRAGLGADFSVRCIVVDGSVQEVKVLEASIVERGHDPVPSDVNNLKNFGSAFMHSIESALKQWSFRQGTSGDFELRIRFRSISTLVPGEEYVIYRYDSASSLLPRQIDIEAHYSPQLG